MAIKLAVMQLSSIPQPFAIKRCWRETLVRYCQTSSCESRCLSTQGTRRAIYYASRYFRNCQTCQVAASLHSHTLIANTWRAPEDAHP